jgi:hypothetical protein
MEYSITLWPSEWIATDALSGLHLGCPHSLFSFVSFSSLPNSLPLLLQVSVCVCMCVFYLLRKKRKDKRGRDDGGRYLYNRLLRRCICSVSSNDVKASEAHRSESSSWLSLSLSLTIKRRRTTTVHVSVNAFHCCILPRLSREHHFLLHFPLLNTCTHHRVFIIGDIELHLRFVFFDRSLLMLLCLTGSKIQFNVYSNFRFRAHFHSSFGVRAKNK